MGIWWLCCPIGNSLQTSFIDGLDDDGPLPMQHQDPGDGLGSARSPEEPARSPQGNEEQCTASLLTAETRARDGAPTHRRTGSSGSRLLPKEVSAA